MKLKMKLNSLKRILYLIIFMVLPLLSFGNQQPEALYAAANSYYAKGQFQHALDNYKKILAGGTASAELYYNLGNASYKTGDLASALLYYEKARKLSPNDEDIKANIRLANSKTTDKVDEIPELFLISWWKAVYLSASTDTFAILSILLVLAGSALLITYFFAHAVLIKKASFYSAVVLLFFGLAVLFIANRQVSYFEHKRQGIVFNSPVAVKSAPSDDARNLFIIHSGTKVSIIDTKKNWIRITLTNGNEGWMKVEDLKEI